MSEESLATSELTPPDAANRMPAHEKNSTIAESAPPAAEAAPAGSEPRGEAVACRPYVYDEVAPAAEGGAPVPAAAAKSAARAVPHDAAVEVVETDGVVREFVVTCSCGRRTRLRVDYGEAP